ncbi:uncharacterized protein plekhg6 [Sphaeramia orbicularis]|uniref:DH domain-containing protein n=1 Tax=Sphaeramia orbicularis TaxID=375764 RepID=A0A672ZZ81_9TELE|nr:pleckstrin homology domain-containing family G member 6 [Sphaeramia orbicularis]
MDPTKASLSSKAPHVNNRGGNESPMDDTVVPWRDSVDGERQRDSESREMDGVDGTTAAADTNLHHRGSADKHKFNTLGYQRRTKQKVVTDFASVSKGTSAGAKPRAALRQVLFSQGVSDKNLASEERGQLDMLKQALEVFTVAANLKWKWDEENQGTTLEKNWTDLVNSHSMMSKVQRHQQEALWEFVHTELTYINKLIIIRDLVIAALLYLHQHRFLLEVTPELLFSNLPSIISAHQLFWQEVIYPMLQEVRNTGKPFDPMRLEAGCLQFHERFASYHHYCWEEENNLEFTRRQMESNPHFLTFVQWVESHPLCERMRVGDMQAKPHQRITKYPLLLKAMLKTTTDSDVQQALRAMLSSVISFLESINDYLRFKDEELALSISAQRVEGYEVEGINEEIDRHVREVCQFNLTCPIRGVGPGVVRKLLLEENLKIRGRKDSKLEVVALLFSDVLLMTKVQKKGERLKVIRPPLALDRTYCITLKDGCSFVLVEVGELASAMNVYIFVASTSNRCSTWVSTIRQTQNTLRNLREAEKNRQMEKWKIEQLEDKPVTELKTDVEDTTQQPLTQQEETFVDKLSDELIIPQSVNGMLSSREAGEQIQPLGDDTPNDIDLSFWPSRPSVSQHKPGRKAFPVRQKVPISYEWIEMERVRGGQVGTQKEVEEKMVQSRSMKGQPATWNHMVQSAPNLNEHFSSSNTEDASKQSTRSHTLFLDGYPDIDYPTNDRTLLNPYQPTISREVSELQREVGKEVISRRWSSDVHSMDQDTRRHSTYSQPGDMEMAHEAWGFSKNIKSPGLRRRRPVSTHQGPPQASKQLFQSPGHSRSASNNSSSNSDSDCNLPTNRNSVSSGQSSDSLRVLKLGSLRPNQGMFWTMNDDRVSPDPHTLSEPEQSNVNFYNKRPKVKTQRSASIPNIIIPERQGLYTPSVSLSTLPRANNKPFPVTGRNPNGHSLPLEGLLERAKERVKDQDGLRRDGNIKNNSLRSRYPPPSPLFSTTPSPSPSDGDRDTEWEEVEVMRHRALTVSKGWKEQLVDGDDDDKRSSVIFSDGVNVDWSGWCFDDEEVMDHLHPGDEVLVDGVNQCMAFWELHELSEQEDGECSQV